MFNRKKGMILEVDLEYPHELNELHNDYPLAAEKIKVTKEMISSYCTNIQERFGINIGQVAKLISTLADKYLLLAEFSVRKSMEKTRIRN